MCRSASRPKCRQRPATSTVLLPQKRTRQSSELRAHGPTAEGSGEDKYARAQHVHDDRQLHVAGSAPCITYRHHFTYGIRRRGKHRRGQWYRAGTCHAGVGGLPVISLSRQCVVRQTWSEHGARKAWSGSAICATPVPGGANLFKGKGEGQSIYLIYRISFQLVGCTHSVYLQQTKIKAEIHI